MGVNGHWYVEIRKQAYWRGNQHTWVNRYVMSGAQPSASDAQSVITAIKNIENSIYPVKAGGAGVGFVDGKAYPSGKGSYFAIIEYNASLAPGTATGFTSGAYGGDASPTWGETLENCFLLETPVTGLSSTGKPVALRKFYRGLSGGTEESDQPGQISGEITAAVNTATLPFRTGMGSSNWVVIGNNGEQASGPPQMRPYIYNRQVPKGRKKKVSASLLTRIVNIVEDNPEAAIALSLAAE